MKAYTFDDYLRQSLRQLSQRFQPPADGRERLLAAARKEGNSVLNGLSYLPRNTQYAIHNPQSTILTTKKEIER